MLLRWCYSQYYLLVYTVNTFMGFFCGFFSIKVMHVVLSNYSQYYYSQSMLACASYARSTGPRDYSVTWVKRSMYSRSYLKSDKTSPHENSMLFNTFCKKAVNLATQPRHFCHIYKQEMVYLPVLAVHNMSPDSSLQKLLFPTCSLSPPTRPFHTFSTLSAALACYLQQLLKHW